MKKIEAIIRPSKLEELKDCLQKFDITGLTISQVLGCGRQKGFSMDLPNGDVLLNVLPKIEIKMVVDDSNVDEIITIISSVARTGKVGDGKIFISDISDCVRIRTNERGSSAL